MTRAVGVVLAALLTVGCHGIQANPVAPGPSAPFADPIYVVTLTADATTLPFGGGTIVHAQVDGAPDGTRVVFSVANGSMWIEPTEPGSLDTVGGQAHAKYHRAGHIGATRIGASVNSASKAEPLVLTVLEPDQGGPTYFPPPPKPQPPPDPPYVPQPQVAVSLAASPTTGTTATVFSFTATAVAHSGAAPVTSYAWTFGDGSSATTAGNSTTHQYATTGTKTARVVASNGTQQASDTVDVTVGAVPPPTVAINCSTGAKVVGPPPTPSTCVANATVDGVVVPSSRITQVVWDFGDATPPVTSLGNTSAPHQYASANTFTVFGTATITGVSGTVIGVTTTTVAP